MIFLNSLQSTQNQNGMYILSDRLQSFILISGTIYRKKIVTIRIHTYAFFFCVDRQRTMKAFWHSYLKLSGIIIYIGVVRWLWNNNTLLKCWYDLFPFCIFRFSNQFFNWINASYTSGKVREKCSISPYYIMDGVIYDVKMHYQILLNQ